MLWWLALKTSGGKKRKEEERRRAMIPCGLRKWLYQDRVGLYHHFGDDSVLQRDAIQRGKQSRLRGLQSLLGQQVRAKQSDNFTEAAFTWVENKPMNGYINPLINCKNLDLENVFPMHFPRWHLLRRWPACGEHSLIQGGGWQLVYWADS